MLDRAALHGTMILPYQLYACMLHACCLHAADRYGRARVLSALLSLGISLADVICVSPTHMCSAVHVRLTYTRSIEVSREVVTCTPGKAVCARDDLDIFPAPVHNRTDLP